MNPSVEAVVFVLGILNWVMVKFVMPNLSWRTSTVNTTSTIYETLWKSCVRHSTGVRSCREFPLLLPLSGYIQESRALSSASVVLGIFGLVAALIALPYSKAAGDSVVLKGRFAGTAGVFFNFQGICTMVGVSCYCLNINEDFFHPVYPGIRSEIGEGLYAGWCSAALAIAVGICYTYSCRMYPEEIYPLSYQVRGTVDSGAALSGSAGESTYEISTCF